VNEKIRVESEGIINICGIPFTGMKGDLLPSKVCFCCKPVSTRNITGAADPQSVGNCISPVTPENNRPER
jgi:hypothetical protein